MLAGLTTQHVIPSCYAHLSHAKSCPGQGKVCADSHDHQHNKQGKQAQQDVTVPTTASTTHRYRRGVMLWQAIDSSPLAARGRYTCLSECARRQMCICLFPGTR